MFKRITAAFISLLFVLLIFGSCAEAEPETTAAQTEPLLTDCTLSVGTGAFSGVFNPFFAKSTYDNQIAQLTGVPLLTIERGGSAVTKGIAGEKVEYKGTNYTYYGIADCKITQNKNESGVVTSVDYKFTLRDDVRFSDGSLLTVDDVIFSMYVLCDPTYNGSAGLKTVPILGLSDYIGETDSLTNLISRAGRSNRSFEYWTKEQQTLFWEVFDEAGERFAESIVEYVVSRYPEKVKDAVYGADRGESIIGNDGLETAYAMAMWGYGSWDSEDGEFTGGFTDENGKEYDCEEEFPSSADFWSALQTRYERNSADTIDYTALDSAEAADKSLFALLTEITNEFDEIIEFGDNAPNIAGIVKTGDNSFTVTTEKYDALTVCQMAFTVAPLHYYGNADEYNYGENKFGFTKGDLSSVREKSPAPMGAGAYKFVKSEDGTVTLEANTDYYLGSPVIKTLEFKEVSGISDAVSQLNLGVIDICEFTVSASDISLVRQLDAQGQLGSDSVSKVTILNNSYGYIGICAKNVLVGSEAGSDESKNLRKAFATVFAACREEAVADYYGDLADIIEYPISSVSWAAPRFGESGYESAYSRASDSSAVYTGGMTAEQRLEAAQTAAKGYLEAAGFTFDDEGKAESAPRGARLKYTITVPAKGSGEHPAYGIAEKAASILEKLGITLEISDPENSDEMWTKMYSGELDMWAAAWESAIDPDMYSLYYSANYPTNTEGTRSNYYYISDSALDSYILEARASSDRAVRRDLYAKSLKTVLDWGVEVPLYQSKHYLLLRKDVIDETSLARNITPFYGWLTEINNMKPVTE